MSARMIHLFCRACVCLALGACGEYAPVNPYDGRFPITASLAGPDTAFSLGDTVQFTLVSEPAWTGTAPGWKSGDPELASLGGGRFKVLGANHSGIEADVYAEFGGHRADHKIVLRQRTAALRWQTGHAASGTPYTTIDLDALGAWPIVTPMAFDARGRVVDMGTAAIPLLSRDTSVVRVEGGVPFPVADGTTWVVASQDLAMDSLRIHVHQELTAAVCAPGRVILLAVGHSFQLTIGAWTDEHGVEMVATPVVTGWSQLGHVSDNVLTVSATGMIYAPLLIGTRQIVTSWRSADGTESGDLVTCQVDIV